MPTLFTPPFPAPDWNLDPANYPHLFLIDSSWCQGIGPVIEPDSNVLMRSYSPTCFNESGEADYHGEKTLYVIKAIARQLNDNQITLISSERRNVRVEQQPQTNLPEALVYAQAMLRKGDVVVINLAPDTALGSFANDSLINQLLDGLVNALGGIVVIAAGNQVEKLSRPVPNPGLIVVGGVDQAGAPRSRYGRAVTCYGVVPYRFPGYSLSVPPARPAQFDRSSAATAYIGGLVMVLLNYARSRAISLTPASLTQILTSAGIYTTYRGVALCTPDWVRLRATIDSIPHS